MLRAGIAIAVAIPLLGLAGSYYNTLHPPSEVDRFVREMRDADWDVSGPVLRDYPPELSATLDARGRWAYRIEHPDTSEKGWLLVQRTFDDEPSRIFKPELATVARESLLVSARRDARPRIDDRRSVSVWHDDLRSALGLETHHHGPCPMY